jgi:hypothetical protein
MTLKQYFPLSIAVLLGTIAIVNATPAPLAPFIIILLAAETLVGFELEDHRVPKLLREAFRSPNSQKNS